MSAKTRQAAPDHDLIVLLLLGPSWCRFRPGLFARVDAPEDRATGRKARPTGIGSEVSYDGTLNCGTGVLTITAVPEPATARCYSQPERR
jgi:hypothetical protein